MPVMSALPLGMALPSTSPVRTIGSVPCGVTKLNETLIALPSSVPVNGASPIWLVSEPVILPASSVTFAVATMSPFGVLNVNSHSPLRPPPAVAGAVVVAAGAVVVAAGAVVVAGGVAGGAARAGGA